MKQNKINLKPVLFILFVSCFSLLLTRTAKASEPSPIYRFWSDENQSHFYTASEAEKDHVIDFYNDSVWKYEGVVFQAYLESGDGLVPVYRFWSDENQSHFYTASEAEKDHVIDFYNDSVWKYEGVAYYAYPSPQEGSTMVYRFWSEQGQSHFYTATTNEKNCVLNRYPENVWKYEGEAWWVPNTGIDLSDDPNICLALGPEIRVGLEEYSRTYLKENSFEIRAESATTGNQLPYAIKDSDGNLLATIQPGSSNTRVRYEGDRIFSIYNSVPSPISQSNEIRFEAANSSDAYDIVFHFNRPSTSTYRDFRGKIKLRYFDDPVESNYDTIWAINTLPLEQYAWGMGELGQANVPEHNKVMVTIFRTYGKSKIGTITRYDPMGFDLLSTPSSQVYNGYAYEVAKPAIKEAVKATRGQIVTYKGKTALTAYSSWSDGKTRALDLDLYPYLKPVNDPYGKHPTMSSNELLASGNHMIGLIANGSVTLAYDHKWDWQRILKYYYTGVDITSSY